jgi:pimeloyl-ACP methyl ester carboxylesterase
MITFTDPYADLANGMRLHYVTAGSGPLIRFVHGLPELWYAWRNQLAEFSCDHRAVALDMRGYNLSSKPPQATDYRPSTGSSAAVLDPRYAQSALVLRLRDDRDGVEAPAAAIQFLVGQERSEGLLGFA